MWVGQPASVAHYSFINNKMKKIFQKDPFIFLKNKNELPFQAAQTLLQLQLI